MRRPSRILPALAVMAVVAACGTATGPATDDPKTTPSADLSPSPDASKATPSAEPASGLAISRRPFALSLPQGWDDIGSDDPSVILSAADLSAEESAATLIVTVSTSPVSAKKQIADFAQAGRRHVIAQPDAQISGVRAAHVSAVNPTPGAPLRIDTFLVRTGEKTYSISFGTSNWMDATDRVALIDSVLAAWTWR